MDGQYLISNGYFGNKNIVLFWLLIEMMEIIEGIVKNGFDRCCFVVYCVLSWVYWKQILRWRFESRRFNAGCIGEIIIKVERKGGLSGGK